MELKIKRVYSRSSDEDGIRILVDRIWPRGLSKEKANISSWEKNIAPSKELRKWFNHQDERFDEFKKRYREELDSNGATADFVNLIKENLKTHNVTLVYGAKNEKCNQAIVLKEYIEEKLSWKQPM